MRTIKTCYDYFKKTLLSIYEHLEVPEIESGSDEEANDPETNQDKRKRRRKSKINFLRLLNSSLASIGVGALLPGMIRLLMNKKRKGTQTVKLTFSFVIMIFNISGTSLLLYRGRQYELEMWVFILLGVIAASVTLTFSC